MSYLGRKFCGYFYLKIKHQSNKISGLDGLLVVGEFICVLKCSIPVNIGISFKFEPLMAQQVKVSATQPKDLSLIPRILQAHSCKL